jgi:hypothetical protein
MNYSRYKSFISNGSYKRVPFIEIPVRGTDCYAFYEVGKTRLDLLSYQYYNDPNYGWLILQANPSLGSLEYRIENNSKIRIPYPLDIAIQGYEDGIRKYDKLYGLN